mgnify:CR=1 FL=1
MTSEFDTRPDVGSAEAATAGWHALLHARLANQPTPVVLFSDSVRSAASLWVGMRSWISTFRAIGLGRGDRVVSVLPAGDALLQLTLACLWESVGLVLEQATADADVLLVRHDARCLVGAMVAGAHVLEPAAGGWPVAPDAAWRVREPVRRDRAADPGFADAAVGSQAYADCLDEAHRSRAHGLLAQARVVTLCDWQERTGLWGGVILPLLNAEELFVPADRTDITAVERLLAAEPVTHALVDAGTPAAVRAVLTAKGVAVVTLPVAHR